jgi:hypothetical protein
VLFFISPTETLLFSTIQLHSERNSRSQEGKENVTALMRDLKLGQQLENSEEGVPQDKGICLRFFFFLSRSVLSVRNNGSPGYAPVFSTSEEQMEEGVEDQGDEVCVSITQQLMKEALHPGELLTQRCTIVSKGGMQRKKERERICFP